MEAPALAGTGAVRRKDDRDNGRPIFTRPAPHAQQIYDESGIPLKGPRRPIGCHFVRLRLAEAIARGDDPTASRLRQQLDRLLNGGRR
jgi:hypothetical protein